MCFISSEMMLHIEVKIDDGRLDVLLFSQRAVRLRDLLYHTHIQ